jgi:hypothetical protein
VSSNNYSDVVGRLKLLTKHKGISKAQLGEVTGIKSERWGNVLTRKVAVRLEEILKVGEIWPMFRHWLIFGEELPESGQISPMTEQLAKEYLDDAKGRNDDYFEKETMLKHVENLGWGTEITSGVGGIFISRIKGLTQLYESGEFAVAYKNERDSKLKRLNRIHQRMMNRETERTLTIEDVKAVEWLNYLSSIAVKQGVIKK